MKIINRATFLALPAGIVYSKFKPHIIEDIAIKSETRGNDWYYQDIASAIKLEDGQEWIDAWLPVAEAGASIAMDFDCESRDGLYDQDQLFAVWSEEDVIGLITRLQQALAKGGGGERS